MEYNMSKHFAFYILPSGNLTVPYGISHHCHGKSSFYRTPWAMASAM